MISSPQFSSSANIRMLGQVIDEYTKEVRKQVYELGFPTAKALQEVSEEKGTGEKARRTGRAGARKKRIILPVDKFARGA